MKRIEFNIPSKTLRFLKLAGQLGQQRGESAYAVGGFVRDLILKRPVMDIDITVEGDGLAFAAALAQKTGSRIEAFTRFGTSIVIIPGLGKVDVATARTETYLKPGALPTVEKSEITFDLFRRDFTINAMALSLSPVSFLKLIDPFQGLKDLRKGRIRALHNLSFVDDPTRVFRAVRFEQRFQKKIEPKTQKWLLDSIRHKSMNTVSGERLRNEFQMIFKEPHPERAVRRLAQLGVLVYVDPSLGLSKTMEKDLPEMIKSLAFFKKNKVVLDEKMVWFQTLLLKPSAAQAAGLSKRLMLSKNEKKIVAQSVQARVSLLKELRTSEITMSQMHRLLSPLAAEVQCFFMALASPLLRRKMGDYFLKIQKLKPWLQGRDLKAFGMIPGLRYAPILREALNGQLDGRFKNRTGILQWVRRTFKSEPVEGSFRIG
jgi:tRNA nucleotidyltransferase (CCA-adding enzyme)